MRNPFRYFNSSTRSDPPDGDDVFPISLIAALGRGPAVRAWHQHLPINVNGTTGGVEFPGRKDPAEVRLDIGFNPQSFQSRTSSHATRNIQAEPRCGNGRMASAGGVIFS